MPFWEPVPAGDALMSANHLANAGGGFEPQRAHNFELQMQPPTGDAEVLLKSVEVSLGISHSSEPLALPYMNETIYIAGRPQYAPGQVVYRDFVDQPTYAILESWYNLVYNPLTALIGFASEYKSMGILTLYDVKGDSQRQWDVIGVWPQDLSMDPPSHLNGDVMRLNVTFQFDKAVPKFAS